MYHKSFQNPRRCISFSLLEVARVVRARAPAYPDTYRDSGEFVGGTVRDAPRVRAKTMYDEFATRSSTLAQQLHDKRTRGTRAPRMLDTVTVHVLFSAERDPHILGRKACNGCQYTAQKKGPGAVAPFPRS